MNQPELVVSEVAVSRSSVGTGLRLQEVPFEPDPGADSELINVFRDEEPSTGVPKLKTIHKYSIELNYEHKVIVLMPYIAKIVLVGSQNGQAFLWAMVDTGSPLVERHFRLIRTGQPIPGGYDHVGSFAMNNGESTCHLFE